ncbi:MAG: hypothetical protein K2X99_10785 [Gemmatimonadaceae bacterium]|nr:hypothetical protein [Gemmatimonadaceae bacterium]
MMLCALRSVAAQQPTAPVAPPSGAPSTAPVPARPRRTVEIRGQAPAPEVVTVRPRELPTFSLVGAAPLWYDGARPTGTPTEPVRWVGDWPPVAPVIPPRSTPRP